MGLDMHLYAKAPKTVNEDGFEQQIIIEIGYWRKHPDLNEYIILLNYEESDGWEIGNGEEFYLPKQEIEEILEKSEQNALPKSKGGFFWGESCEQDRLDTIEIMTRALEYIDRGYTIEYRADW